MGRPGGTTVAIEPFFESIAAHSPDTIMLLDRAGAIRFINRVVDGLVLDEVVGSRVFDFVPEPQHAAMRRCFERVVATREQDHYDNVYRSPKGVTSFWETRVGPIVEGGDVTGFVLFSSDVTERRALEEQLVHAQKMDAVGQLAGGVAHDFNNLLMTISANAELARRRGAADDPQRSNLDEIIAATDRASALARQLLTFSRRQPMTRTHTDLNELTQSLMQLLRRVIPESIDIRFDAGDALDAVLADRSQVEQVLMNLCVNARDAMPHGGILSLSTKSVYLPPDHRDGDSLTRPGRYVEIAVSDTGCGIAPELRGRIFEPFFTTKEAGTGLGLSTVYGIVRQHEGALHLESEPQEGATFRVLLPVAARTDLSELTEAIPEPEGGAERLLLAEDDPKVRSAVSAMLERAGYRVVATADGEEALESMRDHEDIALAILDIVMPRMSGPEAARRIREHRAIPILFTSGYSTTTRGSPSLPASALPDGIAVIPKPYTSQQLLSHVRARLDAQRDGAA
ncbi:MAG: ATP-binding protein [Sandaracinaceae bacterium]